jgi:RNA polymerase sigma-70 factor (ECF subfamily)
MDHQSKPTPPRCQSTPDSPADDDRHEFDAALTSAMTDLRRYARRWAWDRSSAEELLQRAAERALRGRKHFRPGTNPTAWIRRIVRNVAIDEIRRIRQVRRLEVGYGHLTETEGTSVQHEVDEESPRPLPSVAEVRQVVDQMEEPRRSILLLHLDENLSYKAMSIRLGLPMGTISSNLDRARRTIRAALRHGSVPHERASSRRIRRTCRSPGERR